MEKLQWNAQNMAPQTGKLFVITGANSGLGYESALALAAKGARVVMACRSLSKGAEARDNIYQRVPEADLELMPLDLADLSSIREFSQLIQDRGNVIDVLLNNAGVMATPYVKTKDGFEMQLGTNHLGHFALTAQLLSIIKPRGRVVNVSSGAHVMGKIRFDNLQSERGYNKWRAYGQSKLANLLFSYELDRKLRATGSQVISVAAHPGVAATNLALAPLEMQNSTLRKPLTKIASGLMSQNSAKGALSQLYAATESTVSGGDYYGPSGWLGLSGSPSKVKSSSLSRNKQLGAKLWSASEDLAKVTFRFNPLSQKNTVF